MDNLSNIEAFASRLISARKAIKMNQDQLAKKAGVGRDLIIRMERGENVGIHNVLAVVSVLGKRLILQNDAESTSEGLDAYQQNNFGEVFKSDVGKQHSGVPSEVGLSENLKSRIKVLDWNK